MFRLPEALIVRLVVPVTLLFVVMAPALLKFTVLPLIRPAMERVLAFPLKLIVPFEFDACSPLRLTALLLLSAMKIPPVALELLVLASRVLASL